MVQILVEIFLMAVIFTVLWFLAVRPIVKWICKSDKKE